VIAQIVACALDMLAHLAAGELDIARHRGLSDRGMLGADVPAARLDLQERPPVAVVSVQQLAAEVEKKRHVAAGNERQMEVAVGSFHASSPDRYGIAKGEALELDPQLRNLGEVRKRNRSDPLAAVKRTSATSERLVTFRREAIRGQFTCRPTAAPRRPPRSCCPHDHQSFTISSQSHR
jgi:hypothetical protein